MDRQPDSSSRLRLVFWIFGLLLAAFLGYVVTRFVGTFVFGIFFYYATRPLYRKLQTTLKSETLTALVSLITFILPVVFLLSYTLSISIREARAFTHRIELDSFLDTHNLQFLNEYLKPYFDISTALENPRKVLAGADVGNTQEMLTTILDYVGFFGTASIHLFVMLAIAFYLLRDGGALHDWACTHLPNDDALTTYISRVDDDLHNIFFGNIVNAVVVALFGAILYNAFAFIEPPGHHVPVPTLLGLLLGIGSLIPVVGMKLVYIPVTAYLTAQSFITPSGIWFPMAFFIVSIILTDLIPDFLIRPYVSGRNLHVGSVMIVYVLGTLIWGWYGLFLGPLLYVPLYHFGSTIVPELADSSPDTTLSDFTESADTDTVSESKSE